MKTKNYTLFPLLIVTLLLSACSENQTETVEMNNRVNVQNQTEEESATMALNMDEDENEEEMFEDDDAERMMDDNTFTQDNFTVTPISHATMLMQWGNLNILTDPVGEYAAYDSLDNIDIVVVTDVHGDHLSADTIENLASKVANLVVPQAVYDELPESLQATATVIGNDEMEEVAGVMVTGVAMYNLPETADSRHPKGRGNGYILEMDGKRVYISGDTEDVSEMRNLTNIDVAFICMNLPYTMDADAAAEGVLAFAPSVVLPYHYRPPDGFTATTVFAENVNAGNTEIEVIQLDWYAND
jgi:L-ascorbate metabolism protein UlaG (beta-lactamase superfamily)